MTFWRRLRLAWHRNRGHHVEMGLTSWYWYCRDCAAGTRWFK